MAGPLAGRRVVVLPDFFIDAVVSLPPWRETSGRMAAIAQQGGGNLPVGPVELKVGGNAANAGLALARLGADAALVAQTDGAGLRLLEKARAHGLDIAGVREGPASSATLALEFGGANVMLSHAGPLAQFGPARLRTSDWEALESADAVLVANWSQNRKGTELLRAVVRRLQRRGIFVAVDTADPRHRGADLAALLGDRLWQGVGCWALNENELRAAAEALDVRVPTGTGRTGPVGLLRAAVEVAGALGCRLDVHTESWAATVAPDGPAEEWAWRPAAARRLTGAGDAWTAGDIAGHLLGLPGRDRLRLAHAVARAYVTGRSGLPPAWADLPAPIQALARGTSTPPAAVPPSKGRFGVRMARAAGAPGAANGLGARGEESRGARGADGVAPRGPDGAGMRGAEGRKARGGPPATEEPPPGVKRVRASRPRV